MTDIENSTNLDLSNDQEQTQNLESTIDTPHNDNFQVVEIKESISDKLETSNPDTNELQLPIDPFFGHTLSCFKNAPLSFQYFLQIITLSNTEANFFLLVAMAVVMGPLYLLIVGSKNLQYIQFTMVMSLLAASMYLVYFFSRFEVFRRCFGRPFVRGGFCYHPWISLWIRSFLVITLSVSMPSWYDGAGPSATFLYPNLSSQDSNANIGKPGFIYDSYLVQFDTHLMGWLFEKGQLGLYVQFNHWIGPMSFLGKCLTELLQICYMLFYFLGYVIMGHMICWMVYARSLGDKDQEEVRWRQTQMFMCSWLVSFLIICWSNTIFPAVSPRVFLADDYKVELNGFGMARTLRELVESSAENTYGSFPSGHVAASWICAFCAFYLFRLWRGWFTSLIAFGITLSVLYLRYHYIADVLSALLVVPVSLFYGGFWFSTDRYLSMSGQYSRKFPSPSLVYALPVALTWFLSPITRLILPSLHRKISELLRIPQEPTWYREEAEIEMKTFESTAEPANQQILD